MKDTSVRDELRAGISILWRYRKVGLLPAARCMTYRVRDAADPGEDLPTGDEHAART
jgi:predicted Rdx family selenoprotein